MTTTDAPLLGLSLRSGSERVWSFLLEEGKTVAIGRSDGCEVVLSSPGISRRHALITRQGDKLVLSDHSHNGTLLDRSWLKRSARALPDASAKLTVGPFELELRVEKVPRQRIAAPQAPAAPALPAPPAPAQPAAAGERALGTEVEAERRLAELRRRIHRRLLDHLELPKLDFQQVPSDELRSKVLAGLWRIVGELHAELGADIDRERLVQQLCDEALGLGPLEELLRDPRVSEIMVVEPRTIYAERGGKLELTGLTFTDDDSVRAAIERIVTPLGRRIDESAPMVDARLKDGSRVNAVIPPLAVQGPCITIRKFPAEALSMPDLIRLGTLSEKMANFLERAVRLRKNIVVSGGTGSGKTTLLNVLSAAIPASERLVTIEDAAELRLRQPHVVSLESRPPNLEGRGEYTIRDLLKNALRMRPDRIIVGECRGPESIDMLQAMNTGHEGSMTTTHANTPREALARIETLCLMAGVDLPVSAIRRQIATSVHLIVQQMRFSDGTRRVVSVAEVAGLGDGGEVELREIFCFERQGTSDSGQVLGEFVPTGILPSFVDAFLAHGLGVEGLF